MCQVHLLASTHPLASGFHVINTLPQHVSVDLILTAGRQATVHAMIVNTVFDSNSPGEVFACWRVAGLLKLSTTANQLGWNLTFDATWSGLRVTFYLWNSTWRCRFNNLLANALPQDWYTWEDPYCIDSLTKCALVITGIWRPPMLARYVFLRFSMASIRLVLLLSISSFGCCDSLVCNKGIKNVGHVGSWACNSQVFAKLWQVAPSDTNVISSEAGGP